MKNQESHCQKIKEWNSSNSTLFHFLSILGSSTDKKWIFFLIHSVLSTPFTIENMLNHNEK